MPVKSPERISLATLPTPLVRMRRLEQAIGAQAALWLKRDDLTGLELSGNKVRKLEYIAAEAIATGHDTLVTEGTPQSNHCRATATVCAKLGLHARLLLRPEPGPTPVGNHLLDVLLGASTRAWPRPEYASRRDQIIADTLAELRAEGRKPRFTPAGASEPLGCWGYIRAAAELADQIARAGVGECDVVVGVSSGGTYAGLILGRLLHRLGHLRIHGVPVSDDVAYQTREIAALCRATVERYALPVNFSESELHFVDGYVGAGYAVPYAAAIDAIRLVAQSEGVLLDPVYTAKAFCAFLDGVRSGTLGRDRPAVFLHTGGIFSDFAWPELLAGQSHTS